MNEKIINELIERYPKLAICRESIIKAYQLMKECYDSGGKILCCGNGGSSADCDHFVGELMKGFLKKRPLSQAEKAAFRDKNTADGIQKGLPALSLTNQSALITAFSNDCSPSLVFAQQVYALGKTNDLLLAFSTSGNSENIIYSLDAANAVGMKSVAITGNSENKSKIYADLCICLPETETFKIQELTLPVYHCLAAMLEDNYFKE